MANLFNNPAVFRDASSHCCLRVAEDGKTVTFITIVEDGGSLEVQQFTVKERDFYQRFEHELEMYPVKRAAKHFLNPLTGAITVSTKARNTLESIMSNHKERVMSENTSVATKKLITKKSAQAAVVPDTSSKSEANIAATEKGSVRTNNKVHDKPEPAPVTVLAKDKKTLVEATTKKKKGTWEKKETNSDFNKAAQRKALADRAKELEQEAKKAERDAKKADKTKSGNSAGAESKENTVTDSKTPAKKTAAAKKAPVKKVVAKLVEPKAAAAKTPAKKAPVAAKTPAKKALVAAKKVVKKKAAPAAKKAAAPAKGKKSNGAGRPGKYSEEQKIKLLVDENPKRAGSSAFEIFELLKKSKTVGDFYKKGGASHNLRFNEDKGYIKVG